MQKKKKSEIKGGRERERKEMGLIVPRGTTQNREIYSWICAGRNLKKKKKERKKYWR